jgi:ankyrin repeat protein
MSTPSAPAPASAPGPPPAPPPRPPPPPAPPPPAPCVFTGLHAAHTPAHTPGQLVEHIFECIATLRESVGGITPSPSVAPSAFAAAAESEVLLGQAVVRALTAEVSQLFRQAACGGGEQTRCPAPEHGYLEAITVGSLRHSEVLDRDFKVGQGRGGAAGISCRRCQRESVLHDRQFNYCPKCRYVRCQFCTPHGPAPLPWRTLGRLLTADPAAAAALFPGSRLLLHEVAALVPGPGEGGEAEALGVLRLLLSVHPQAARAADGVGDLPCHWACCGRSAACLAAVLDAFPEGAGQANHRGELPLHMACKGGSAETVRLLLARSQRPHGLDRPSAAGCLPLHLAVSRHRIVSDIVLLCLQEFPDGIRLMNKKTKQLPLHYALSNRDYPDMQVVRSLLIAYPGSALLPLGEEAELPLHMVLSRPAPSLPALYALLDICPEGALTASAEVAWAAAETPLALGSRKAAEAFAAAADLPDQPELAAAKRAQGAAFLSAVRIMLSRNRRHDPALLSTLNWEARKQAMFLLGNSTDSNSSSSSSKHNIFYKLNSAVGGRNIAKRVVGFI